MARIELSEDGRASSTLTGILFGYAILVVVFISFERSVMGYSIIAALTCVVALVWKHFSRFSKTEFDEAALYARNVRVAYHDVVRVYPASADLGEESMLVVYRQDGGAERKVRFIPHTPELLYQFFKQLTAANASADIEYIEFLTKKKWAAN